MQNKLRELRLEKQLTQQELADIVNVSRQSIISIETNRYIPSVTLSLKLAEALGKKVEDLFKLQKGD